jgi:hypothetical protein
VRLKCGEMRSAYRVSMGKPEGKTHRGRTNVDVEIILNRIFNKYDGGVDWIGMDQNRNK